MKIHDEYKNKDIEELIKLANEEDVVAQVELANKYYNGDEIKQDYQKHFFWLKNASEKEYPRAQSRLGDCYYSGEGVEQDYSKAIEKGHIRPQYSLGICCYRG